MKNFIQTKVPIYVLMILLIILLAVMAVIFLYYRQTVLNYNVVVSSLDGEESNLQYGEWPKLANADFFNQIKEEFIKQKATFVEADLSSMKLQVYENGEAIKQVDILSKGKKGSWWETPAGLYKAETKSENLFSSFGHVYMPYSIAFQGNFFIHGWPYYQDGSAVSSTYSGGCIRLSTEDAKKIYNLIKVGTPILVFESDFNSDGFVYQQKIPEISAPSYLVADLNNNFVFLEKNSSEQVPIASISKLVSALVAVEYMNLEKQIIITQDMIVKTSKPRLVIGKSYSVYDLLFPLLMESSNESAEALAQNLGRDRFINLMNNKAKSLGMINTHFVDPSGSGDGNASTGSDLFQLAKYIYNNRSFIFKASKGVINSDFYGKSSFANLENFNIFYNEKEFIGGKIGLTTSAGQTILSVFEINYGSEMRPIVFIALNSQDNEKDVQLMKDFIQSNYQAK